MKRYTRPAIVAAILLITFLPQLIAWSPYRHRLPRERVKGYPGTIRVGSASLKWWGPTVLSDVTFFAIDGSRLIHVDRITENRGLFASLFNKNSPLKTVIEQPTVYVSIGDAKKNLDEILAPVWENRDTRTLEREIKIVGGTFEWTDLPAQAPYRTEHFTVEVVLNAEDDRLNRVDLVVAPKSEVSAGSISLSAQWPVVVPVGAQRGAEGVEATVNVEKLAFERIAPIWKRIMPNVEFDGFVSGRLKFNAAQPLSVLSNDSLCALEWSFDSPRLEFKSTGGLESRTLTRGPITFAGRFEQEQELCRLSEIDLKSEMVDASGGISFLLPESVHTLAEKGGAPRRSIAEDRLKVHFGLPALARRFADRLPFREQAEIKSGAIDLVIANANGEAEPVWTGRLETTPIRAEIGGNLAEWKQPLHIEFELRRAQGGYRFEKLESQSDVFVLQGNLNDQGFHLLAGCDLHELQSRLGTFLDTDHWQLAGSILAEADFREDIDHYLQIDTRVSLSDFSSRRLSIRMEERRAGDFQPAEPNPPAPPPKRLPADPSQARRETAAQRRAERQSKQQQRRDEREARRAANKIVEVPVEEWRLIWKEPLAELAARMHLKLRKGAVDIDSLDFSSSVLTLHGTGWIKDIPSKCDVKLDADLEYDWDRCSEVLRETIGPNLIVKGAATRSITLRGPLRTPDNEQEFPNSLIPVKLTGDASIGWSEAGFFGLPVGAGEINWRLQNGAIVGTSPEISLGGGTLNLRHRWQFTEPPASLEFPAVPILNHVQLTDEFCEDWLKYIAPLLSQATRCSGMFTLVFAEGVVPLADPASAIVSGKLIIENGQVVPGPLVKEIQSIISNLIIGIGGTPLDNWLETERPFLDFPQQAISFEFHEGRIHHESVECRARGVVIRTHGSVGLDQSLDMVASISLSDEMARRGRLFERLQGRALDIPIGGTLKRPSLDPRAKDRIGEQLGREILDQLLKGKLKDLFE